MGAFASVDLPVAALVEQGAVEAFDFAFDLLAERLGESQSDAVGGDECCGALPRINGRGYGRIVGPF